MKMKKMIAVFMAASMLLSLTACGGSTSGSDAGKAASYTAKVQGYGGEFEVTTTLEGDTITKVEVGENKETPGLGSEAIDQMPGKIVESQSIAVDGVGGATITSAAILEAVADCLTQAGKDPESYKKAAGEVAKAEDETVDVDIVVVGAGGAGLSAAIEAANAGKSVLILEKMSLIGGNTIKATGGMNASETFIQVKRGGFNEKSNNEYFYNYTYEGGHKLADPELLHYFVDNSASAIQWLADLGMNFTWVEGATVGIGHTVNDGGPVGPEMLRVLKAKADALGAKIRLNTNVTEILMKDGTAVGVVATGETGNKITVNAKAVILATGGFGGNMDMVVKYRPELKGFVTTNHPGATGDGIVMAEAVGAALTDIEQIQIHPTVEQDTSSLITEGLRKDGGILLNTSGKRFFNECSTRDKVSQAILAEDKSMAYLVIDQGILDIRAAAKSYIEQGFMKKCDTVADLAAYIGVDEAVVAQTLTDWNAAVAAKSDAAFSSEFSFDRDLSHAPYYVVKVAPGVHHTMGGLKINTDTQVISTTGAPIPGLYAAGEITGGIHGGNRIGGNAVTDIVVFGRTAGQKAAAYIG